MTRVRSDTALRRSHWISLLGYVGFRLATAACEALLWTTTSMARTTEAVLLDFGRDAVTRPTRHVVSMPSQGTGMPTWHHAQAVSQWCLLAAPRRERTKVAGP